MREFFFKDRNITYYIPGTSNPGDEKLWRIFYRHSHKSSWHISNIRTSLSARLLHNRIVPRRMRDLFARISAIEGKGSKMAFKILVNHPYDPIIILGVDAETGELFEAKYAETDVQRFGLSRAYETLTRLQATGAVPKILQYVTNQDAAFIKTPCPEGEHLYENEMNEDILKYLISLSQFSMNQLREENSVGLVSCVSNGSFAPWNVIKGTDGSFHMLQWQHASDKPLGYDLLYYLNKPYIEHNRTLGEETLEDHAEWLERFYAMFGIEDYGQYVDANAHLYAAQLESEGRYIEANRVRMICRALIGHICKSNNKSDNELLSRNKVLFIMHMPPPVHGASMVGKWIHESEYVNSKFDCYYLNLTFANSIADVGVVSIAKTWRLFKLVRTVKHLIRTIKPDLVYMTPNTSGIPFIKDSIVVNTVKSMGYPVLAHFHNKGVSRYEANPVYRRLYRKFFDKLKVLLIVPSLYDDNKTFLRIRDLYICPNGTPDTIEQEIKAERHNDVPEILFLSNMIISKGVLDLLDALYLLRGQNERFHCTMIGPETSELSRDQIQEEIDSRHLTEAVDYIGPRYGAEKNKYFEKADILAFPTYYPKECFPLVVLEAMEYKIPVVSTFEAGIPYSVIDGQTGLLCKSQNPIDLSEKITKLLADPELRWRMGEEGYKLRKQRFSIDTFEKNFAGILMRTICDVKVNTK